MSLTNLHADWLSLIDISGPFLAIPVLMEAFPQGLEELNGTKRKRVRQAYDEWREALEEAETEDAIDALDQEVQAVRKQMLQKCELLLQSPEGAAEAVQVVRSLMFVERFRADIEARRDQLGQ